MLDCQKQSGQNHHSGRPAGPGVLGVGVNVQPMGVFLTPYNPKRTRVEGQRLRPATPVGNQNLSPSFQTRSLEEKLVPGRKGLQHHHKGLQH